MKHINKCFLAIILLLTLLFSSCDSNDISLNTNNDEYIPSSSDVSIDEYTVTFETNGGTTLPSQTTNEIKTTPITTKNGYTFKGWYNDKALTDMVTFPLKITTDTILYAKWEKISYTISFDTNGGTKVSAIKTSVLTKAPQTTKQNYIFQGWYLDENLTTAAIYPIEPVSNMTLYAKWLKIESTSTFQNAKIKDTKGYYSESKYNITPNGFEMEKLASEGYKMKITIEFDIRYEKDYDAILNIGYAGAPKYEVYLNNTLGNIQAQEDIKATTYAKKKTIEYTSTVASIKNDIISLKISTNNIQNIIYIENFTVTYECYK